MKTKAFYIGASITAVIILSVVFLNRTQAPTDSSTITKEPVAETGTQKGDVKQGTGTTQTQPIVSTKGFNSYANGSYNFTVKYPSYVKAREGFFTFHELGNTWRLYPPQGQLSQGKAIVSFAIFNIDQGSISTGRESYPLFYTAEVRVGVTDNTADCYKPDASFTDQKVSTVVINGTTFKKFSTQEAGMMKYTQAESYRTIHNKQCFVIEQIKYGTSYRDEKMKPGISDKTLEEYYTLGATIIKTFTFTK